MDEMHFISQNGDTMAVADPLVISFISISPYRFYYDKGYLQSVVVSNDIVLAFKQELITGQAGTKGAFGIKTNHPGANSYSYFTFKGSKYNLAEDEVVTDTKEIYFFGDSYGHFSKAGKEFILNHFNKQQDSVKAFIKENHISFNKEEDLLKLLRYCEQLKS